MRLSAFTTGLVAGVTLAETFRSTLIVDLLVVAWCAVALVVSWRASKRRP